MPFELYFFDMVKKKAKNEKGYENCWKKSYLN